MCSIITIIWSNWQQAMISLNEQAIALNMICHWKWNLFLISAALNIGMLKNDLRYNNRMTNFGKAKNEMTIKKTNWHVPDMFKARYNNHHIYTQSSFQFKEWCQWSTAWYFNVFTTIWWSTPPKHIFSVAKVNVLTISMDILVQLLHSQFCTIVRGFNWIS